MINDGMAPEEYRAAPRPATLGMALLLFGAAFGVQIALIAARYQANENATQAAVQLEAQANMLMPTWQEIARANAVARPLKDEEVPVVSTSRASGLGRTVEGSGCAVSSSGLVLTVAHGMGELNTTCSVWGNTKDRRGYKATYRVLWIDKERDLALLAPDQKLTATVTWRVPDPPFAVRAGSAVEVAYMNYLELRDIDSSASCAKYRRWTGLHRTGHVTSNLLDDMEEIDIVTGPGVSGAPVFDSSGRMFGMVAAGIRQKKGVRASTLVTLFDKKQMPSLLKEAETSAALMWATASTGERT